MSNLETIKAELEAINLRNSQEGWNRVVNGEIVQEVIVNDDVVALTKALSVAVSNLADVLETYPHPDNLNNINTSRLKHCQLTANHALKSIAKILSGGGVEK